MSSEAYAKLTYGTTTRWSKGMIVEKEGDQVVFMRRLGRGVENPFGKKMRSLEVEGLKYFVVKGSGESFRREVRGQPEVISAG